MSGPCAKTTPRHFNRSVFSIVSLVSMIAIGGCQSTANVVVRTDPNVFIRSGMKVYVPTDTPENPLVVKNVLATVALQLRNQGYRVFTTLQDVQADGRCDLIATCSMRSGNSTRYTSGTTSTYVLKKQTYTVDSPSQAYDVYGYEITIGLVTWQAMMEAGGDAAPAWEGVVQIDETREAHGDNLYPKMIRALFEQFPRPTNGAERRPLLDEDSPSPPDVR